MTPKGLIEQGNADVILRRIEEEEDQDDNISEEDQISVAYEGFVANIPTVIKGKRYSEDEARKIFQQTGKHLGKFDNMDNATKAIAERNNPPEERTLIGGN